MSISLLEYAKSFLDFEGYPWVGPVHLVVLYDVHYAALEDHVPVRFVILDSYERSIVGHFFFTVCGRACLDGREMGEPCCEIDLVSEGYLHEKQEGE